MSASEESGLRLDLDPTTERRLKARARLKALRQSHEERWAAHPWPFLRDAVSTIDQQKGADGGGPRKWPGGLVDDGRCTCPWLCKNYYEHVVRLLYWCREQGIPLVLPKSRRLLASWTCIAYAYWLCRYRPGQLVAFASRKQGHHEGEGSAELVRRANQIHENLPPECAPMHVDYSWCRLKFPNGSEIMGIAQGADQARQYTFTLYLADEFAFWEWAGKTYAALLPTLEGGGQFVGISTAGPGFMEQLVHDRWASTGGDE